MHSDIQCCCGRLDCALLRHNCHVLESVEKDVHTAAELGQALLARHEAYMATAERERLDLAGRVSQLEIDKRDLELENARTIEENRALLDQLEIINASASDSESRVRALEAALRSSQQATRRLEGATQRAADMERHIAALEQEQLRLQSQLATSETEARATLQRWRKAERGIVELQDQLERMEREAREERDRHAEVMSRMRSRREMERDLDSTAGRLRGPARVSRSPHHQAVSKPGSMVVSHFVRDLLQENANLQLGIAELREMLMSSNDEIQSLREQLLYHHQPCPAVAPADPGGGGGGDVGMPEAEEWGMRETAGAAPTLRAELEQEEGEDGGGERELGTPQQVHIHHHYHSSPGQREARKQQSRKRQSLTHALFAPSPATSQPAHQSQPTGSAGPDVAPAAPRAAHSARPPSHCSPGFVSTPAPAVLTGLPPSHRWSVVSDHPSDFTASSVPSSPQSYYRHSVFDRVMAGQEMDAPWSPTTSVDPASPSWRVGSHHRKGASDVSARCFVDSSPSGPPRRSLSGVILEEASAESLQDDEDTAVDSPDRTLPKQVASIASRRLSAAFVAANDSPCRPRRAPRLRRAASRESIMSLSGGLDIHTLASRPSQLRLRPLGTASAVVTGVTAQPIISGAGAAGRRGETFLRDNLAVLPGSLPGRSQAGGRLGLARLVSWRPWRGGGGDGGPGDAGDAADSAPAQSRDGKDGPGGVGRAPGINQPGAIPGFQEYLEWHRRHGPPAKVSPDTVDREALREGLEG